jgi:hypothetical protein
MSSLTTVLMGKGPPQCLCSVPLHWTLEVAKQVMEEELSWPIFEGHIYSAAASSDVVSIR